MSKSITCFNDLRAYGIDCLTGEADNLGFRMLCDFTKRGQRILTQVFGGVQFQAPENWNSGDKDDPHVGSIMLSHDMLTTIGIIALLDAGCTDIYVFSRDVTDDAPGRLFQPHVPYGFHDFEKEDRDETLKLAAKYGWHARRFGYNPTQPHEGNRNVHAMSGRTA